MSRLRETLKQWVFVSALLGAAFILGLELRTLVERHGLWPGGGAATAVLPPAVNANLVPPQADPRSFVTADEDALRQPMVFRPAPGGVLRATGTIDLGAASRLAAALDNEEQISTVSFNSPGGTLNDAMAIARLLRQRGLTAVVEGGAVCASSCPLALAGGRERMVSPQAAIGVHQFYSSMEGSADPLQAAADAQMTAARIARHLSEMGIDPAIWLYALETPPRALYYLREHELRRYRLVTEPRLS
ncbi:ATP-dependent Clp protease proteolytic subunit [Chelativorans sp. YIM 93263]|uniref:ATP-dependent Clp protease proteolytic subunit n=1 Tax=Chelativorans sp. YIM 93263 TaxID=2906648 RepID=UPI002378801C|nr:ATP-dependent Clp protease proteolytic subunit [Chelativorans sp. YIM 93263]